MTAAILDQVLTQVAVTIQGLSLTGISSTNIVSMLSGDDQGGKGPIVNGYPCVVCYYNGGAKCVYSDNVADDWVYPVIIATISVENADQVTNRERNWLWRDALSKAFHHKRLLGLVPSGMAWDCEVDMLTPVSRPRWLQGQHFQAMIANVKVRQGRT